MNKLFKIFLLALVVFTSSTAIAQGNSENTVIVSGFVLNSTTQEGITANITIKNAESFRVVTVIPTSNLSGSYTFKLVKGRYYFVVETPGFELFSVLVDLSTVSDKRIQRNLVLLPVGAIRNGYFPVQDNNGNDGSLNGEPVANSSSSASSNTSPNNSTEESSSGDEMGWGDSNPEANESIESSASTDNAEPKEDDIDVQIVKPGERLVENGKVVYTGVPVSSSGKILKEAPEDIMNSEGTSNVEDIGEGRESEINFTIKGSAQFVDVPMYFNKNDASTVNVTEQMKLVLDFLKKNSSLEIEIRGYSETGFSSAMQKQIALQRSVNVKKYFSDNGISMMRLEAIAYPTSDYELVVERKRLYRKQHLVEFRIKGDDAFEQDFRARFEEEYSQYKEGDVPQVTIATITDADNSTTNTRPDLNSDSDVNQGIVNNDNIDLNTFTTSSNNSVSANSSNSTTDNSITNATSSSTSNSIQPPSPAVTPSPEGSINNTGSVNNDDNAVIGNESSDPNRKDINGIAIDSEGSDYQIGYEGYNPNSDTVVTQDVFDALDKINASADRIDRMTISFEAKLAEVDEYKYKSVFDSIYIFLMNNRRWSLDIYGYASKKGDKKEASVLHKNRAQNVYHVLINKGVDKTRIKFKGKGNAMAKTASGEKIPVEKQMIVTFKLKKPNLSGMNDNVKVDKTAQRGGSNSGREAGRDNSSGAKTNYDDSKNGYDDLRTQEGPAMPEFKTEMEYINYLKNNQGQLTVPGLYFRVQVGAFNLPLDSKNKLFKIKNIELLEGKDGMYRYVTEKYVGINDAYTALKKVKRKVDDAFVLAFYKNQKITMKEATQMLLEKRK